MTAWFSLLLWSLVILLPVVGMVPARAESLPPAAAAQQTSVAAFPTMNGPSLQAAFLGDPAH